MRGTSVKLMNTMAAFGLKAGRLAIRGSLIAGLGVSLGTIGSAYASASSSNAPDWLCVQGPIVKREPRPAPSLPAPSELEKPDLLNRHMLALKASEAVGSLPDLDENSKGSDLIGGLRRFSVELPEGYEYFAHAADAKTGVKLAILSPVSDRVQDQKTSRPWIIVFAGTQKSAEWIANPSLVQENIEQLARQTGFLLRCGYQDELGRPLSSRDFIITGHGLGGGIAQAFAFLAQKQRANLGLRPLLIDLVTWNAFGARGLVEKIAALPAGFETWIQAANYFLPQDPMAKIGSDIGDSYEINLPAASAKKEVSPQEMLRRHSLAYLNSVVSPAVLESAVKVSSPRAGSPLALLRTVPVIGKIQKSVALLDADDEYAIVSEAVRAPILAGAQKPDSAHALMHLAKMIRFRVQSFNDVRGGSQVLVELLAGLLEKIEAALPAASIQND